MPNMIVNGISAWCPPGHEDACRQLLETMPKPNPYRPAIQTPIKSSFGENICVQCLWVGFAAGFAVALPIGIGLGLCLFPI